MEKLYRGKPLYNAVLEDETDGIMKVSLVSAPAVMVDFITLSQQEEIKMYAVENEEEKVLLGVVMVADTPIYRIGISGMEYYINFTKETIKMMAEKMIFDGNTSKVNLEHLDNTDVEGINLVEIFIKDIERGINPIGFDSVPDGSLFAKYKVHNEEVWQRVKSGEFKGFSLEGYFNVVEAEVETEETLLMDIMDLINKIEKRR